MLSVMVAAAPASVPLWTWVFFAVMVLVVVVVASIGMQRARAGRPGGGARVAGGLTPEQRAFQDEMRMMLEVRLQERYGKDDDRPADPPES